MKLAIKGHDIRFKDVQNALKMLGGTDCGYGYLGNEFYYYINDYGYIVGSAFKMFNEEYKAFTIEEYEKKYPYKKGDLVLLKLTGKVKIIKDIFWNECLSDMVYVLASDEDNITCKVSVDDITYYGPNNCSNNDILKTSVLNENCVELIYDKNTHEIIIDESGRTFISKRKLIYPETYKECCKILDDISVQFPSIRTHTVKYDELFTDFYKLIICRNAYWKLFDNWEPNFCDGTQKYTIECHANMIVDCSINLTKNIILVFPTPEMRDAFHKNFEVLIEKCKMFL